MTNILPQEYKRSIKKEYRLRLLTTSMVLLGFLVLGSAVLLIPSYLMSNAVEKTLEGEIVSAESSGASSERTTITEPLYRTKRELEYLALEGRSRSFEETVRTIVSIAPAGVSITRIALEEGDAAVRLSGIAATRGDLLLFNDRIEEEEVFSDVELPVSSLAKGVDISFSMELSLASTTPQTSQ
jgi:hypothetical protein